MHNTSSNDTARSLLTDALADWGDPEFFGRLGGHFVSDDTWQSTRSLAQGHAVNDQNLGRFTRVSGKPGFDGMICAECCGSCPIPEMAASLLGAPVVRSISHAEVILRRGAAAIWCGVCEVLLFDLDVRG